MIQQVLRKMAARFYPRSRSSNLGDHDREGDCLFICHCSTLHCCIQLTFLSIFSAFLYDALSFVYSRADPLKSPGQSAWLRV